MWYLIEIQTNKVVHKSENKVDFGGNWSNPSQYMWQYSDEQLETPIVENNIIVEGKSIDELKQKVFSQIDKKTDELIAEGFIFDGRTFSLSLEAQSRLLTTAVNHAVLNATPNEGIAWNTIDDSEKYIISKEDIMSFCISAQTTIKNILSVADELKDEVRTMTTIQQVKGFVDYRNPTGE